MHPLRVDTSWVDGDRAAFEGDTAASRLEGIDVVKTLDLQPGEDRTESIRIVTIGTLAVEKKKKKTGRRDCRVTVRECRAYEPSKVAESATTAVVDFSGVLCSGRLHDDSSPAGINTISAESYRLVSFNGCLDNDNDNDTTSDGNQSLVISELSLEFHADTTVRFIDIFVEVVALDDSTADLVAELSGHRIDTCDDCALLPEEFFRQFPADRFLREEGCLWTSPFSRVLSIRILLRSAPGVRLTRYDRLLPDAPSEAPSVHLPVLSAHEASRVAAAINEALSRHDCCPTVPPGEREISLLQPRTKVLFEVGLSVTACYHIDQSEAVVTSGAAMDENSSPTNQRRQYLWAPSGASCCVDGVAGKALRRGLPVFPTNC